MIIALSGTQGCGKTTTINDICANSSIKKIESQAARTSIKQMNCTLMDIYEYDHLIKQFQELVLFNKEQDEILYHKDNTTIYVIERSYIDLAAYTILNLGRYNKYSDWLNHYVQKCIFLQRKYDCTYYLTGNKFIIQDDKVRPTNQHFADAIESVQLRLLKDFNHILIDTSDRKQRSDQILHNLGL